MKTIIQYEGQKTTIQGKSSPREAMEICGLDSKEWKVASKEVTDKAALYILERIRPLLEAPRQTRLWGMLFGWLL